jgi:hypothetical protein
MTALPFSFLILFHEATVRLIPEHARLDAQGNQCTCDYAKVFKPMSIECPN